MKFLRNKIITSLLLCFGFVATTAAHDILVEAKGSIFVPTNEAFRDIYNNCGDFGLEFTGNLFDHLYGFTSVDFLFKDGQTVVFNSSTRMNIVNIGVGAKYFVPFKHGDFYIGLGIEPTYFCTHNQVPEMVKQARWTCGGIAKSGVILNMPNSFFVDLFFDYSFVKADFYTGSPVQLKEAHLDGCLFGIGVGYRFN